LAKQVENQEKKLLAAQQKARNEQKKLLAAQQKAENEQKKLLAAQQKAQEAYIEDQKKKGVAIVDHSNIDYNAFRDSDDDEIMRAVDTGNVLSAVNVMPTDEMPTDEMPTVDVVPMEEVERVKRKSEQIDDLKGPSKKKVKGRVKKKTQPKKSTRTPEFFQDKPKRSPDDNTPFKTQKFPVSPKPSNKRSTSEENRQDFTDQDVVTERLGYYERRGTAKPHPRIGDGPPSHPTFEKIPRNITKAYRRKSTGESTGKGISSKKKNSKKKKNSRKV